MHVFAKEIDTLQKHWDKCEADLECARSALKVIVDLLTTDLEGHHTHAQRNGMVILIRQQAKSAIRQTENSLRIPYQFRTEIDSGDDDLPF